MNLDDGIFINVCSIIVSVKIYMITGLVLSGTVKNNPLIDACRNTVRPKSL